jgi:uncharacterized protein
VSPLKWLTALTALAALVLTGIDFQAAWIAPGSGWSTAAKLLLYWMCWLLWPMWWWLARRAVRTLQRGAVWTATRYALAGILCSAVLWGRFVEPNWLQVHETTLGSSCGVKVALISDIHMGSFGRAHDLERLVARLNTLQIDAILVAGDWTAEPAHDLAQVFAPLKKLRHPVYSVTGNHDEEHPGPPLTEALRLALTDLGVRHIEDQAVMLGQCELVGLGDLRSGSTARELPSRLARRSAVPSSQRIVLTHEPETGSYLPADYAAWMLAGHTHGGQIQLPWLSPYLLKNFGRYPLRRGSYQRPHTKVFITSGVGTSGIPFRFRVRPVVDVLSL